MQFQMFYITHSWLPKCMISHLLSTQKDTYIYKSQLCYYMMHTYGMRLSPNNTHLNLK